ncbi:hypothetical protein AMAG_17616 [Allomyces macrogynus ATCC 38327]|uniref:non-specific serine/threonine protein kinase n=1 Tax=Allomyces macrogynus (strain ATCC 38327) TaxID=578462 RepID=A0A0L0RVH4_ALLM3|nr:hypothetical protein AMAG_17616 [Allomyces macrogynus ATCC 38327]|eukprot:KNE54071.1 hypothetical protein AMAG_17616 [Allomyces macrogynus ATCC 38327]
MTLVEALALSLEADFKVHLPVLLPHILGIFESDTSDQRRAAFKVLDVLCIVGSGLEEYMFLVLRPLMRLIEHTLVDVSIRKYAVHALAHIIQHVNLAHHASRIIHPLVRCLAVADLRPHVMDALVALVMQMRTEFMIFVPIVQTAYVKHKLAHPAYERCLAKMLRNEPMPEFVVPLPSGAVPATTAATAMALDPIKKLPVNQQQLKKVWEASQQSTKDDWLEWMWRLSIELLKESPSPALRACASLASVQTPLARSLFNASFVSCWSELHDQYQDGLVQALETALTSPNIPPELLQALLNLAEFMEHDDKPLPIDLRTLGKYATKCQAYSKALDSSGRFGLSHKTLTNLLKFEPDESNLLNGPPPVVDAYLKHMWETGRGLDALKLLSAFTGRLAELVASNPAALAAIAAPLVPVAPSAAGGPGAGSGLLAVLGSIGAGSGAAAATSAVAAADVIQPSNSSWYMGPDPVSQARLLARCYFWLAEWQTQQLDHWPDDPTVRHEILQAYRLATHYDKAWYRAWHAWALANLQVVNHHERALAAAPPDEYAALVSHHVVPALQGFVHSISLSRGGDSLQDTLRLLTLWFKHGHLNEVHDSISKGFSHVTIDTWLQVIPQLIAWVHTPSPNVRRLIHQLLCDVGKEHPQALIYSLMVASKSSNKPQKTRAALSILDKMRMPRADLVDQGLLVSKELIRVAILWHEMWHEGLEEASRFYFGEGNADAMIAVLEPLHQMMHKGPETLREISFHQAFGRDLAEAHEWVQKFLVTREKDDINQAWKLYSQVFKKIAKQLTQLPTLKLLNISPALLAAKDLQLAESRKILLNIEHRLMVQMVPDYENLTLIQKMEVFECALENTTGQDLAKVLWLKSKNSEAWLDRRTNYARSLATMSMVGYILGLGDRHPSNLMLDRYTGKVVHIDFGDCFEVAMLREKFPEKIPFRLTRMLVNAMEVSGIEGSFRITCEHVMRVLRENKDSVMAVLEAFVYDPLINWRLMTNVPSPRADKKRKEAELEAGAGGRRGQAAPTAALQPPPAGDEDDDDLVDLDDDDDDTQYKPEALNARAVQVVHRVSNKLTGRDFKPNQVLDVPQQVDKLIQQATSLENLCLCYIGWCAFW